MRTFPGPDGSFHYDGTVQADIILDFSDASEGEINATVKRSVILDTSGTPFELAYDLTSNDIVPESAGGKVVLRNFIDVLPS